MNIGDLIYPPGIVLPIIPKRKIEGVILRPILDKTLGCDGILTWVLRKIVSFILSYS